MAPLSSLKMLPLLSKASPLIAVTFQQQVPLCKWEKIPEHEKEIPKISVTHLNDLCFHLYDRDSQNSVHQKTDNALLRQDVRLSPKHLPCWQAALRWGPLPNELPQPLSASLSKYSQLEQHSLSSSLERPCTSLSPNGSQGGLQE